MPESDEHAGSKEADGLCDEKKGLDRDGVQRYCVVALVVLNSWGGAPYRAAKAVVKCDAIG